MKFLLCIPTYNAEIFLPQFITAYKKQTLQAQRVLIIDSSSTDNTVEIAKEAGFIVQIIKKEDFNHGSTRNLALNYAQDCELIVFMTQDAILAKENALENLCSIFKTDNNVAISYGRQLPLPNSSPIAAFARIFNYGENSHKKTIEDREKLGIKAVFCSNSFCCYKKSDFVELGQFPATNFAEDSIFAARALLAGKAIFYNAEAEVFHAHDFNFKEIWDRYKKIGKAHRDFEELRSFLKIHGAGSSFVKNELKFLWKNQKLAIPKAVINSFVKYFGYKYGKISGN